MAVLTLLIGTTFLQSLVIAVVSATLTGLFLLAATIITVRAARDNRDVLHDIKRKVGASKRLADEAES